MEFSKWDSYKLSQLVEIIGGGTPKRSISNYWNGTIPWLSVKDFNNDERLVHSTSEHITELGLQKSSTKLLKKGDIIISARGTVGEVAQLTKPMAFNQSCYGLIANERFTTNEFIYYWLKYNVGYIKANTHGSIFDTITKETFDNLNVFLPPKEEQEKITELLIKIDDKIEVNKTIIANLEKVAQEIFWHWYEEFNFISENGKSYKSNGGELIESELGLIPKNWTVERFDNICSVKDGTHDSPKQAEEGYPLVTSKHLIEHRIDFAATKKISVQDFIKINKRSEVERFDILMSMIGTVGRLYLVQDENINFAIKNVALFKTSEVEDKYEYLYCLLKSKRLTNYIIERLAGSTQQYISLTELRKIPVLLPDEEQLKKFKNIAHPLFNEIYTKTKENIKLVELRNTLLPKLLSGELELPNEIEVTEHVSIP